MLAPEFLPAWGGVGTYIVELLRHLPTNVEVHVLAPSRDTFGKEKAASTLDISRYFKSNVKIHFICKASDTFFYNARFQYECLKHVPPILKEEQIDLIHSHTAHMPDLLLMLRKIDIPIVTTVHTTIKSQRVGTKFSQRNFSDLERSEKATYILYPALRLAEEIYYRRKRFYISPSNWMKEWLNNTFHINENVSVIPNSVDVSDYEFCKDDPTESKLFQEKLADKTIILYVGRLLAMKGVDILMEAIPNILKRIGKNNVIFVFVGPGGSIRYLNMAKSMKVESSCIFTGAMSREGVIQLMRNSTLLVAPSFMENAPYTILESMACGLPVIASNVGGVSEIIESGYNGTLVKPNSSKAIANCIINLLENNSSQSSMRQHAIETVRTKFSWSVNLKKYLEVYSNALTHDLSMKQQL
jgi:glycosyltransferase involved in cell wall biosynthesis